MEEVKYGKLINGKIYMYPGHLYCKKGALIGIDEDVLIAQGYKRIQYFSVNGSVINGKLIWIEKDQVITQVLVEDDIESDPVIVFQDKYRDNIKRFGYINDSLKLIRDYQDKLAKTWAERKPLFGQLYDDLVKQHPDKTIKEILNALCITNEEGYQLTEYANAILANYSVIAATPNGIEDADKFCLITPFIHIAQDIEQFEEIHCSMLFSFMHTLLDDFISSIIRLVILLYPLGGELKIDISPQELFQCNDINEIKAQVINDKITKLGYENYQSKIDFLSKRGINPSLPKEEYIDDIILFYEYRNAFVHNAGIVNRVFVQKIANTKYKDQYKPGTKLSLNQAYVKTITSKIIALCDALYDATINKYKIEA